LKLSEAKRDYYRKLAKEKGYRSRASFKLIQINKKYRFIQPNHYVIDFGAAPGGWLEVASDLVSSKGKIIGIDITPIEPIAENVEIIVCDINNKKIDKEIIKNLGRKADVILSDLSPNISGIWSIDYNKQIDLTLSVINRLPGILNHGGSCLLKIFDGPKLRMVKDNLKNKFTEVRLVKPKASRSSSSELYILCKYYKPVFN
tara:strand:- start:637 stop:1242 length:606 start_codon:yes stop_codon:yes gene_type:complete